MGRTSFSRIPLGHTWKSSATVASQVCQEERMLLYTFEEYPYVLGGLGVIVSACPIYRLVIAIISNGVFGPSWVFASAIGAVGFILATIKMVFMRRRHTQVALSEKSERTTSDRAALAFIASDGTEVPEFLSCPITKLIMREPVLTMAGNTYECLAIVEWLRSHDTDPVFNTRLQGPLLTPNVLVRRMCKDFEARVATIDPAAAARLFPPLAPVAGSSHGIPRNFTAHFLIRRTLKRMQARAMYAIEEALEQMPGFNARDSGYGEEGEQPCPAADEEERGEGAYGDNSEDEENAGHEWPLDFYELFSDTEEDEDGGEEDVGGWIAGFGMEPPFMGFEEEEDEDDIEEEEDEETDGEEFEEEEEDGIDRLVPFLDEFDEEVLFPIEEASPEVEEESEEETRSLYGDEDSEEDDVRLSISGWGPIGFV